MGIFNIFKCSTPNNKTKPTVTSFHGMEKLSADFTILNENFGRDSQQVYYKNNVISGADAVSFQALDSNYGKDTNAVYYCFERRESKTYLTTKKTRILTLEKVDPLSFKVLENGYGKDKNQGVYEGTTFFVKDLESFKCIGPFMAKDKYCVYYESTAMEKIDGQSFELINAFYAKDKNNYFIYSYPGSASFQPKVITDVSSELILLEYPYSKNKENVFYQEGKVVGIHPDQCIILNSSYIKDDKHAFLNGQIIKASDASTFTIPEQTNEATNSNSYSMDKNHVYFGIEIISNANPKSFSILGFDYGKDKQHIFYKNHLLIDADYGTFEVSNYRTDDGDAKDKKSSFKLGKRLKND